MFLFSTLYVLLWAVGSDKIQIWQMFCRLNTLFQFDGQNPPEFQAHLGPNQWTGHLSQSESGYMDKNVQTFQFGNRWTIDEQSIVYVYWPDRNLIICISTLSDWQYMVFCFFKVKVQKQCIASTQAGLAILKEPLRNNENDTPKTMH